ncbi:MAG: adenine phosphoribosyltransferase [Brooklawnia sp.]|uniref:adenine phosphoribosyltransferase n=1 Tax=Brooklawnia sp. TaxID=2699740 RepID=UPI003C747A29
MTDPRVARAAALIRNVPDFPQPGVQFKDITPILGDISAFRDVMDVLAEQALADIDVVCGVESRGFLFGAPLALQLGVDFAPIRKPGKLPSTVVEEHFDLEYGSSMLAMHTDAVQPGQRVLLVDDLLATGGTLIASVKLVERLGASVAQVQVVIELTDLGGRQNLVEFGVNDLYAMIRTS